jgi:hypothetical protein
MRKIMLALIALASVFVACEKKAEVAAVAAEPVVLPMEVSYKGTPSIGDVNNVKVVMEWNKRISERNFSLGDLLADTVTWHLADGMEMTAPRDPALVALNQMLSDLTEIKIKYISAIAVNNAEQKDEWVFSWTDETYTHKDGKIDHTLFHEDYRMENGKIREVFQFQRKDPADMKPATK